MPMKKLISLFLILAFLLCGCSVEIVLGPETPTRPAVTGGDELIVHFIDVGQADKVMSFDLSIWPNLPLAAMAACLSRRRTRLS